MQIGSGRLGSVQCVTASRRATGSWPSVTGSSGRGRRTCGTCATGLSARSSVIRHWSLSTYGLVTSRCNSTPWPRETCTRRWLGRGTRPSKEERHRASTIVADRLCGSRSDPIIRNAQEERQLDLIGTYLRKKRYRKKPHPPNKPLTEMEAGTFTFRMNVWAGGAKKVKIPIDVVIQPKSLRPSRLPILIEAKSAGDFTNVNK